MALIVQCFEPHVRPSQVSLSLAPTDEFAVYLMLDTMEKEHRGLRATILRRGEEAAPEDAMMLFVVATTADGSGMRVRRVNRKVTIDLLRPDKRSRVSTGTELRSGSRFEVTHWDMRSITFSLQFAADVDQGGRSSVAGIGSRPAAAGIGSQLWLVPAATAILSAPKARVVQSIQKAAKKIGLSPGVVMLFFTALVPIVVTLVWGVVQSRKAARAQEQAEETQEQLDAAQAGLDAALDAEAECVDQRRGVVAELEDLEQQRRLQAEIALASPLAMTVAIEHGGSRMATDDVLALDGPYLEGLHEQVVFEMQKLRGAPEEAERCLGYDAVLGQDLPPYVLLWHPDPKLVCPPEYAVIDNGVDRAGSWGLSARATAAFSGGQPIPEGGDEAGADLRINDRWSSHILAAGYRAVMVALLSAETEHRPPVPPSQSQLWALALWDAYNRMPSPAEGVMDLSAEECVEELVLQLAASSDAAVPGQPVLPDITAVVLGDTEPVVSPTAGCPWPTDSLTVGAAAAVRAVSHHANLVGLEEAAAE